MILLYKGNNLTEIIFIEMILLQVYFRLLPHYSQADCLIMEQMPVTKNSQLDWMLERRSI